METRTLILPRASSISAILPSKPLKGPSLTLTGEPTETSILYLSGYGDADWRITASNNNVNNYAESVGSISPKGITNVGNEVWFIDQNAQIRRLYQTD